jgi:NTP pyrophosphatase (non-canonical NTP hydrolase)
MEKETQEQTVQEMFEEIYELGDKIRKEEELKFQNQNLQKAVNPKHTVPFGNGSQQEQDEMEELSKTNPALYAAITSWN